MKIKHIVFFSIYVFCLLFACKGVAQQNQGREEIPTEKAKLTSITIGSYRLTKEELVKANTKDGLTKHFDANFSEKVLLNAVPENQAKAYIEPNNTKLTLTKNVQVISITVKKEGKLNNTYILKLSKTERASLKSIRLGDYTLTESELYQALTSDGFKKKFDKDTVNPINIVAEPLDEAIVTISPSSSIELTKEEKNIVITAKKEGKEDGVYRLIISKKESLEKMNIDVDGVNLELLIVPETTEPKKLCALEGVKLCKYHLSSTEITQELYQKVMQENPTKTPSAEGNNANSCPVAQITWYDAIAFCNELTILLDKNEKNCAYFTDQAKTKVYRKQDGKNKIYPLVKWRAQGFRLPTECEWEYACLGGETTLYPGSDEAKDVAWFDTSTTRKRLLHNVATKKPNAYGFYDMAGNVAEWVWDLYKSNEERSKGKITKNPSWTPLGYLGGSCVGTATIRGGDYNCCKTHKTEPLKCLSREKETSGVSYDKNDDFDIGFRVARRKDLCL